jgi:hypothetical protein
VSAGKIHPPTVTGVVSTKPTVSGRFGVTYWPSWNVAFPSHSEMFSLFLASQNSGMS